MNMSVIGGGALGKVLGVILLIVVMPIFAGLGLLSADYIGLALNLTRYKLNSFCWNHIHADNHHRLPSSIRNRNSILPTSWIRTNQTWCSIVRI